MRPLLDAVEAVLILEDGVELYACVGGGPVCCLVCAEHALDSGSGDYIANVEDCGLGTMDGGEEIFWREGDGAHKHLLRGWVGAAGADALRGGIERR